MMINHFEIYVYLLIFFAIALHSSALLSNRSVDTERARTHTQLCERKNTNASHLRAFLFYSTQLTRGFQ